MPPVADDWRVTIELDETVEGMSFLERVREWQLERDAKRRLGERVAVSADGPRIFLYADSSERAREALEVLRPLLDEHELEAEAERLERWHPDEEEWKDPGVPLPRTAEEREAERARYEAREAAEAATTGEADFEVRVELPSHAETVELADRLEAEGLEVVRRWTFLLLGAPTEEAARELAARVEAEAPPGSRVHAEGSGSLVWRHRPDDFFTVFGGLGY